MAKEETAKHTPGPWTAEWCTAQSPLKQKGWHVFNPVLSNWQGVIADLPDHAGDNLQDYAITKANARLIAAAPELLDMVCEFLAACDGDIGVIKGATIDKAQKLVAKARGQQ